MTSLSKGERRNLVLRARLDSMTHKLVLMVLEDFSGANPNCWPSIQTIADCCCAGRRTVQQAMRKLEELGLLTFTDNHRGVSSRTYWIRYDALADLQPDGDAEAQETTDDDGTRAADARGAADAPAQEPRPGGVTDAPQGRGRCARSPQLTSQLTKTPNPIACDGAEEGIQPGDGGWAERILAEYPPNPHANPTADLQAIEEAIQQDRLELDGMKPEEILAAVKAMAADCARQRRRIPRAGSWFRRRGYTSYRSKAVSGDGRASESQSGGMPEQEELTELEEQRMELSELSDAALESLRQAAAEELPTIASVELRNGEGLVHRDLAALLYPYHRKATTP